MIVSTTTTVDSVTTVSDWYVAEGGHDRAARDQLRESADVLLGRKTYEGLAAYWSPLTGEWADLLNPMPKFVASRALHGTLDWNATVIEGDVAEGVSGLKRDFPLATSSTSFASGCTLRCGGATEPSREASRRACSSSTRTRSTPASRCFATYRKRLARRQPR